MPAKTNEAYQIVQALEERRTEKWAGIDKKGRNTRGVDSHLQSQLDPRSPPLLLP